ncbi:MAG: single-stranded-DNA-specific exonuclease RecJ [Caldilineaceae bacterium]|nr:single-stranded-DNA-specific exonuclease RecJ [Caldilineaceae bacterium]
MNIPAQRKNWIIHPTAPDHFLESVAEHRLLAQVLYNRGLQTSSEVKTFLTLDDAVQENPYKLIDMTPAVTRIIKAIEQGQVICVYGDFDADGVTSTALLVSALQAAGARVGPYIPDRVDEGYGLNLDAIERIAQQAQLLVTVDCGMRSIGEVDHARALGMDVIITDHHSVGPALPAALAVINPRRKDCPSNAGQLAGVGVAFRLAQAILRAVGSRRNQLSSDQIREIEEGLLDLVAIGTVADVMPLLGENRHLVQRGLAQLNRAQRVGLNELFARADLTPGHIDATAISFRIAPRLNAAGRLAHAKLAYQLLRTTDPVQAYTLTNELEALNQQRRDLTEQAQRAAELQLAEGSSELSYLYLVHGTAFPAGIVGLVAGRLTERLYRPTLVVEEGEEESRGSARSIPEFDISSALDEVSSLLIRHGGHSRAAGFTIQTAQLPELKVALQEIAERELSSYPALRPTLHIDAEVPLDEANWGLQSQFARLEPTGQGNTPPVLLCRHLRVREVRPIGSQKQHLRLVVDSDSNSLVMDAVAFQQGEWAKHLSEGSRVDLAFQLDINEWQGRRRLQMNVDDLRLSTEP